MNKARLLVALGAVMLAGLGQVGAQGDPAATLRPLQGMVELHPDGADEAAWDVVTERRTVARGDAVRTGEDGVARVTFYEGMRVEVAPDSYVIVGELGLEKAEEPATVELQVVLGDVRHTIERQMQAHDRYEVITPGAVITVRGTEFWTSVRRTESTTVYAVTGEVTVYGRDAQGGLSGPVILGPGQAVVVTSTGSLSGVFRWPRLPELPGGGALPPRSCGNGICEANEQAGGVCVRDCITPATCGDGVCSLREGESLVTCWADCQPSVRAWNLHFFWGEMRCDYTPPRVVQRGPATFHWGIGCFDTADQANAHPHPADYQLLVDGQPWPLTGLQQTGPHVHLPYCPWGWDYDTGPIDLPVGRHQLTLVQSITDTWTGQSGGHEAGSVNRLDCTVVVLP